MRHRRASSARWAGRPGPQTPRHGRGCQTPCSAPECRGPPLQRQRAPLAGCSALAASAAAAGCDGAQRRAVQRQGAHPGAAQNRAPCTAEASAGGGSANNIELSVTSVGLHGIRPFDVQGVCAEGLEQERPGYCFPHLRAAWTLCDVQIAAIMLAGNARNARWDSKRTGEAMLAWGEGRAAQRARLRLFLLGSGRDHS